MCTVERYASRTRSVFPRPAHGARSPIHQNIKDKIVAASEQDTLHIFRTLHNTARVFKNGVAQQVVALERRPGGAKFEDVRELVSGQRGRLVYDKGDADIGIWTAGIVMGLIKDIPTCEELLRRVEAEAEEVRGEAGMGSMDWLWGTKLGYGFCGERGLKKEGMVVVGDDRDKNKD